MPPVNTAVCVGSMKPARHLRAVFFSTETAAKRAVSSKNPWGHIWAPGIPGLLPLSGTRCWKMVRRKTDIPKDLVVGDRDLQIDTKWHHEIIQVEKFLNI